MKLTEILLFCTLLFVSWFGIKKAEQCERKDKVIIDLKTRLDYTERLVCDSLEIEYIKLTRKANENTIHKKYH